METNSRACRWVCRRLPLLAGDELAGTDRRRVERHLTTCPACRIELAAASRSVSLLRSVGVATRGPATGEGPSLWPDLARQIRESRREEARTPTPWSWIASLGAGRPRLRLGAGLAVAAGLILAVAAGRPWAFRTDPAAATTLRVGPPTPVAAEPPAARVAEPNRPALAEPSELALLLNRATRRPSALPEGRPLPATPGVDPFLPPPTSQVDFDLDRGTLSNPSTRDTQRAY